jgi:hypothetical protein
MIFMFVPSLFFLLLAHSPAQVFFGQQLSLQELNQSPDSGLFFHFFS